MLVLFEQTAISACYETIRDQSYISKLDYWLLIVLL